MTVRPPGRRTESLFDNRYRYDYIYPRGRSGETLRAYDTQDQDRPVVIKRPAPQDAPPMRAGQEVSIRSEKQALERLAGHPVLTELRGSGTFRVGGHTHEYIVIDLATGQTVEEMVLDYAGRGEHLPELEVLVIVDRLLDLLAHAHDRQVIYNDVDAKHLFWDRAAYQLKVIDWGNAVFTDEPGALPTVTRASDIYQCGELLYFILTGGNRLVTQVEDGSEAFFVSFGADAERIPARMQAIITRAVNPDSKRRYGSILELRQALAEYRAPLEKTRDDIIGRVRKRVRATASQEELEELAESLRVAQDMDPGYPEVNQLAGEIQFFLKQITIQADLDAIRIYLESGNWSRASALLHDLLPTADAVNQPFIRFLIAAASLLEDLHISPPPRSFLEALTYLFRNDTQRAGYALLVTPETQPAARQAQWLLAEQLAVHIPEVTLLRPHLVRLRQDVSGPAAELLNTIEIRLANAPLPGLTSLQTVYQQIAALLARLEQEVESLSESETALASVIRAQHAAQDIVERLSEVGYYVYGDPSQAGDLLQRAAMIDPTSPYFDALHDYFDEVHQAISALGQFKPKSDGSNLAGWFADVQGFLQPYLDDLPDRQLHAAVAALHRAAEGWTTVLNYLALGRRQPTIEALRSTADVIRPFNEQIAAWLGTVANRLPDAPFTERHSPNTRLADALIEGWKAWDHSDGVRAAELGQQAHEQARTDGERLAADRLRRLGELLERWLADDGPDDPDRTDQAEIDALTILLAEEEQERRTFAEQMPNTTLYLRAMSRGIVAYMQQSSSAGWRTLFMHYVLRGMLALHNGDLDEAEFWRNAASKVFDDARTHRAFQVLDRALTGRRLVAAAEQALNAVSGPQDLDTVRRALNAPLAGELLAGAEQSVQALTEALRDWTDGDFYAARQSLDVALTHIQGAVKVAGLQIPSFVAWVTELRDAAEELRLARLVIDQGATTTSPDPDPAMAEAHHRIVVLTLDLLGPDYAHQVRQWDDMYRAILDTYTDPHLTRQEKLNAFGRHFASLFITKHPAYRLFRHWAEVIENLPAYEADILTVEPEPLVTLRTEESLDYLEDDREPEPKVRQASRTGRDLPWNWIIWGAIGVLIIGVVLAIIRYQGDSEDLLPGQNVEPTEVIAPVLINSTETPMPPVKPSLTPTVAVVVAQPATETPVIPTLTPTELSVTPTLTEEVEIVPTETIASAQITDTPPPAETAAAAVSGPNQDVLAALANLETSPWPAEVLALGNDGSWVMSTGAEESASIELTPELLSTLFQPGVANMFLRADLVLELVSYNDTSLANGEVTVGLGAVNSLGQSAIGQVQFVGANLINPGISQNGQFRSQTQFPQQNPQITLSVRRVNANTLGFFIDDKWLGDAVIVFAQGDPLTLVVTVSGQDVQVRLSAFTIDYSPRDELP